MVDAREIPRPLVKTCAFGVTHAREIHTDSPPI